MLTGGSVHELDAVLKFDKTDGILGIFHNIVSSSTRAELWAIV